MSAPAVIQPLPPVSGCDEADTRLLDACDMAQRYIDEAEKLFGQGMRMAGMFKLGKAVRVLESVE